MIWRQPIAAQLLQPWITSCCSLGAAEWEHAGALYESWRRFAHDHGAEPGSPGDFAEEMERRGFTVDRIPPVTRGRIRWGLRLR